MRMEDIKVGDILCSMVSVGDRLMLDVIFVRVLKKNQTRIQVITESGDTVLAHPHIFESKIAAEDAKECGAPAHITNL